MRILFVCGADFRAPSEKHVLAYAEQLTRRGHEVAVSLAGDPATADLEGASALPGLTVWRHAFAGRRLSRTAREAARRFEPSLIHAFNCRLPVAATARAYAKVTGAPVLVHFEDDEWSLSRARPGEPRGRRIARRAARLGAIAHPPLWPFASAGSLRWAATHARALDAVTPALADHVATRLGRPCAALLPPMPGVVEGTAGVVELPPALDGRALIVYLGGVFGSHVRDFRLGLQAVAALRAEGRPVAFVHIGDLAPRFSGPALAQEAGLPQEAAVFLGYLPGAAARSLLDRASVLIQPGHPDAFNRLRLPSKVQDYLASGTPTVTFSVGVGELLVDREEVLKTHTSAPSELAERIAEALENADLRARLGRGGPNAAQRLFDPARATDALLEHYGSAY